MSGQREMTGRRNETRRRQGREGSSWEADHVCFENILQWPWSLSRWMEGRPCTRTERGNVQEPVCAHRKPQMKSKFIIVGLCNRKPYLHLLKSQALGERGKLQNNALQTLIQRIWFYGSVTPNQTAVNGPQIAVEPCVDCGNCITSNNLSVLLFLFPYRKTLPLSLRLILDLWQCPTLITGLLQILKKKLRSDGKCRSSPKNFPTICKYATKMLYGHF